MLADWTARPHKWTCETCEHNRKLAERDGINPRRYGVPKSCDDCKLVPHVHKQNQYCYFLLDKIAPGFFGYHGEMDYAAIEFVFNLYKVPQDLRLELFEKIIYYGHKFTEARIKWRTLPTGSGPSLK